MPLSATSIACESLDIPSRINMTMADPPDRGLLWSVFVYTCAALLPLLAEHFVGKLARGRNTLRVILIKYVHNFVCDGECFILERRVTRNSDELAKRGEVPKKVPSGHIGHD